MVRMYPPQSFRGYVGTNTNFPGQGGEGGGIIQQFIEGLGDGIDVIEHNSQIPNLIEDFVLSGKNFPLTNIPGDLEGLQFSKKDANGEHFYIYDEDADLIRQYDMSIPYDLDTAANTTHSLNVGVLGIETEVDFDWGNDGTTFIVLSIDSPNSVLHSITNISIPWQFEGTFDVPTLRIFLNTSLLSLTFSDDGTRLFLLEIGTPFKILQYNLTIPFDISNSSMTFSGITFDLPNPGSRNIRISTNGKHIFVSDQVVDQIFRFELSVANDLSTISTLSQGQLDISGQVTTVAGLAESENNTKIFAVGRISKTVFEWESVSTVQGPIEVVQ